MKTFKLLPRKQSILLIAIVFLFVPFPYNFRSSRRRTPYLSARKSLKMLSRVVRPVLRKAAGPRRSYHAPAGHFKVPTMSELPVPQGSWQENFNSKQRKYNMHLIGGISFFLGTFGISAASGLFDFNLTPALK